MQSRILSVIFLISCLSKANSLECYNCLGDECQSINDKMLSSCGPQVVTTVSSTSTEVSPTPTSESTSTSQSSDVTTSTKSSESTGDTTTKTSSETTSAVTDTSSTTSDTASTGTDTASTVSTSTTSPSETTKNTEEASTTPTQEPIAIAQSMRQRRSLAMNTKLVSQEELQTNDWLGLRGARADSNYYCYRVSIPDGDSSKRKHGCVEVTAGTEPCEAVRVVNSIPANTDANYGCSTCNTDKCNSAGYFGGISLLMLLVVLLFQILCK